MKTVTVDQIASWGPCDSDATHSKEKIKSIYGKRKKITIEDILKCNIPDEHKAWCIIRKEFFTEKQLQKITIFCSKLILPLIEKRYPEDNRPRKTIEAAKNYLKNPTIVNKKVAIQAAWKIASNYINPYACTIIYIVYNIIGIE